MVKKAGIVFLLAVVCVPQFIFAAPPVSELGQIINPDAAGRGPLTANSLVTTMITIVNWFAWFIALAAVVMGLYSGFLFITARDDAQQLATARKTILYAIIGIAVAVLAFSIISITKALIFVQ
ncbi:MAG: hypothetical protein AAB581_02110 [Patescibacteria group bacterium]